MPSRKMEAARRFAERHDPDMDHALQVCRNTLEIYDQTKPLHGLSRHERVLLEAAALMHDVGYETRPESHQKGSRNMIMKSKLEGFSDEELRIVACIARYHGGSPPKDTHKIYRDLAEDERLIVNKLAALLRVGDGLDRSHSESAQKINVEIKPDRVLIHVKQRSVNESDIAAAMKKRDLFEAVYGRPLHVTNETQETL